MHVKMILLAAGASTMFAARALAGVTLPPKPTLESFPHASFSCEAEGHPDVRATVDIDPPARTVTFRFGTGPVHTAHINRHTLGDVGISNSDPVTFNHLSSVTWSTGKLILGRMGKPLFFDANEPRVVPLPACRVTTATSRANGTGRVPFPRPRKTTSRDPVGGDRRLQTTANAALGACGNPGLHAR
jgi:hypothetical protein